MSKKTMRGPVSATGPPAPAPDLGVLNPNCGCHLRVVVHEVRERDHIGIRLRPEVLGEIVDRGNHVRHSISFPGNLRTGYMPSCGCNRQPDGSVAGLQPTIRLDDSGIPQGYWEERSPTGAWGHLSTCELLETPT